MSLWSALVLVLYFTQPAALGALHPPSRIETDLLGADRVAASLKLPLSLNQFPEKVEISINHAVSSAEVSYTLDPHLNDEMGALFRSYGPDYGAFVAMDATTGRILTLVSYTRRPNQLGNLALRALFPAASVFKVVTAAAAIDQHKVTPDTVIAFNGANHTLYKRNIAELRPRARHMTLREAFAKSVNTVFGRLGVFLLHTPTLEEYAQRFAFNSEIPTDVPVEAGRFALPGNDEWAVAEVASGYNRVVQMSPLQGAMIAAAVVNDGVMMQPYLVEKVTGADGKELYRPEPRSFSVATTPEAAASLRALMRETVRGGTSRRAFRGFYQRLAQGELEVGGKTGSLNAEFPRGRVEWFVGYALEGGTRIAVSALTVSENRWKVKPSYLARRFFETYFESELGPPPRPKSRSSHLRLHRRHHRSRRLASD